MRSTIGALKLGDFSLQQFGAPDDVLIRISEQPGGDAAQRHPVEKHGLDGFGDDPVRVDGVGTQEGGLCAEVTAARGAIVPADDDV